MGDYSKRLQARATPGTGSIDGISVTNDLTLTVKRGHKTLGFRLTPEEALELAAALRTLGEQRGGGKAIRALVTVGEAPPAVTGLGPNAYHVTISSEAPVAFSDRVRILDHSPGAILLKAPDLPLQWNHNGTQIIGAVRGLRLEDRKLHGIAFFESAPFAQDVRRKVDAGEIRAVSVGFTDFAWEKIEAGVRVTHWTPIEVTVCKVGANPDCTIMPLRERYGRPG